MPLEPQKRKSIQAVVDVIVNRVIVIVWAWLVVGFIITAALNYFEVGYDSTDGEARSGMRLHTDALTGCQYLSNPQGGITPRLNQNGQHLCDGG